MNEEIDETHEFYHEDFTTATDWEILVAHIEEVLRQWKSHPKTTENTWTILEDNVVYADTSFTLIWHQKHVQNKPKHVLDQWFDFTQDKADFQHSCLANWYGLNEFIVFTSNSVTGTESRAKILLSALSVVSCMQDIPLFVQIKEPWQKMYSGIYQNEGVSTSFDTIHLKRGPLYCQYLTGLLDLYKTKLNTPEDNVLVSCRLTYILKDSRPDNQDSGLFQLPFGVSIDSVSALRLETSWSGLSEHSVIDTESHSDFDPLKAQKWVLTAQFNHDPLRNPISLLADCLLELYHVIDTPNSVNNLLGDYIPIQDSPLDLLTEPFLLRKLHQKKLLTKG